MRKILGAAGLAALALALSACASSASSSSASSTPAAERHPGQLGAGLQRQRERPRDDHHQRHGGRDQLQGHDAVLVRAGTSTTSKCTGSCATYWPPVTGPVTAGSGVTGTLGTITRPDGTTQATYDGHPLYTYVGDTGPGQAKGNGKNLSGGVWYEMTISGATPAVAAAAPPPRAGGYGY